MWQNIGFVVLGLAAGVLSGLFGIGGGLLIIPVLIYFFGMSQHLAQGTTLALMIPPIGLFAAWAYYKQGNVHLAAAAFICLGFVFAAGSARSSPTRFPSWCCAAASACCWRSSR